MSITIVQKQIEADLQWREAELVSLKMLLAASPSGSERQRALLRACTAMLYAHYEGFCKFCWVLFQESVESRNHTREQLREALAISSLSKEFKRVKNEPNTSLWNFALNDFKILLAEKALFPEAVDTESNLWPDVSKSINERFCLKYANLTIYESLLKQLVGRRNKIAHGEKLEIANIVQFQELEHAATSVMHELAVEVLESLENNRYLSLPPAAVEI